MSTHKFQVFFKGFADVKKHALTRVDVCAFRERDELKRALMKARTSHRIFLVIEEDDEAVGDDS